MVTTITKLGTWAGIFGRRSKLVKDIANDLRALIIGLHPDTVEVPRKGDKAVFFGFGEKKLSESYCTLTPQTGHVNLGLWWGAMLDDPNRLMEGKGKKLRHVKIEDQETARSAKIAHLVYLALEERRAGLLKMKKTKKKSPQKKASVKKSLVKRKKTNKEAA